MPAASISITDFLRNLPLFRELEPAQLERLAAGAREIRAGPGTILFRRGDPSLGMHAVVYGQVKLALTAPDGAEKVVEVVGPGGSFGEAVMFLEKPYYVTAEVLADSLVLFVSRTAIFAEIDASPQFARRMLAGLSLRLHRLIGDLEALSLKSGTERVIGYLLRDCPDTGPQALDVRLPVAKGVLASRLNLTREHFSRILHDLAAAGLVRVAGRSVRILDAARLRTWRP
ncbi:MAG: Crp/Fnr family transcriptional regulator [Burkholderiales bacterium]|nr:Crp/Fnr family transcriptional regulator [Burkholderiales bacterium]